MPLTNCLYLFIRSVLIFVTITLFRQDVSSQSVPIIKAHSKQIKIQDGDDLLNGVLVPELKPDIYPYHKSRYVKRVTYYTDIDSISFDVKPGDNYHFGILLNDTDTCYQQITFVNPNKVCYQSRGNTHSKKDTIPFALGPNSAIHVKGRINGSEMLDLIFDTGASMGVLSEQGLDKKASLSKDNKNQLEVAGIVIRNNPITYIDYNGRLDADGVIGYNSFEDKIVEIDYDKSIMVIHDTMEDVKARTMAIDMIWRGSAMFIEGQLRIKNKTCKGLFLFDTGSKWALSLNKTFASQNQLYGIMEKTGTRRAKGVDGKTIKSHTVLLPELHIGNLMLPHVPIDLELPSKGQGLAFNILGNDVLKRFNVVLDYQKSVIYLQQNSLKEAPYTKSFNVNLLIIGLAVLVSLLLIGFVIYRRRAVSREL